MPPDPPSERSSPQFTASRQGLLELFRELAQHGMTYGRDWVKLAAAEAAQKRRDLRILVVSLVIATAFVALGFLFLTVALVSVIAYWLNSWGWASLIVGIAYSIVALLVALPARNALRNGMTRFPQTAQRLQEDAKWVKDKLAA